MVKKNVILIIGNGFDVAHKLKTAYSNFADCFLDEKIVPELIRTIRERGAEHPFFETGFLKKLAKRGGGTINLKDYHDAIWFYSSKNHIEKMIEYIRNHYDVLEHVLNNTFLAKLYGGPDKNWFDIENIYFAELTKLKNVTLNNRGTSIVDKLKKTNSEFLELKEFVSQYLNSLVVKKDPIIDKFLTVNLKGVKSVYVVNFNYTSTIKEYFEESETVGINYVHGSLEENNIVFGYGNDQNADYQEMKNMDIDEFLEFFKTFDYLNNPSYDKIYSEALDVFDDFDAYVLGHSLGMTDKTLLSEILNSDKCKKIHLFKRKDYLDDVPEQEKSFRKLTYSASRILTNERSLRKKIVSFKESKFFP